MRKFTCFTLGLLLACAVTVNAQEQKNDQEGYKFTDIKRLPTTSVKSQDRAGTCWSWSTISFLESEIMRMLIREKQVDPVLFKFFLEYVYLFSYLRYKA